MFRARTATRRIVCGCAEPGGTGGRTPAATRDDVVTPSSHAWIHTRRLGVQWTSTTVLHSSKDVLRSVRDRLGSTPAERQSVRGTFARQHVDREARLAGLAEPPRRLRVDRVAASMRHLFSADQSRVAALRGLHHRDPARSRSRVRNVQDRSRSPLPLRMLIELDRSRVGAHGVALPPLHEPNRHPPPVDGWVHRERQQSQQSGDHWTS